MNNHTGNIQPAIDAEEHARISNTDGKKVFVIDSADNQVVKFRPDVDEASQAAIFIDFAHHELHEGDHHFIKNYVTLTNAQVLDFLAVTPNTTEWVHMVVEFEFEAEAHVQIFEGTTTSANGTAQTSYNRDRNSSNTPGLLVYAGPTVTDAGTQIAGYKAGSSQKVGGTARANNELILKQNTKYLIRITNDTALDNWCDYLADWYEHANVA